MILVSRCLTGAKCRYNGRGKPNQAIIDFLRDLQEGVDYLLICPECAGRLPIPRPPGEITGGDAAAVWQGTARVRNAAGDDYTAAFLHGAQDACQKAQKHHAAAALLKDKSPSCGVHLVHDGSFDGSTIPGYGVTALALHRLGLTLFSEDDLPALAEFLHHPNQDL
ncbi:MAG: DUF523 domain-containing protein [Firmicutes bacterium]|nr:DUF523 domain-containing protein [Bacillota bacterium]